MSRVWVGLDEALRHLGSGERLVLVDGAHEGTAGHLVVAAELASAEALGFVIRHSFGIVTAPAPAVWLARLDLHPMTLGSRDRPLYTPSVDAAEGTTTGISGADRAMTLRVLASRESAPADLNRPGHVFPLIVEERSRLRDPAVASLDLMRWAGLSPVVGMAQVMNDDSSLPNVSQLAAFAQTHELGLLRLDEVSARRQNLAHRRRHQIAQCWPHMGICEWDPDPAPSLETRRSA
ncbi:MAG: 3,4-dihydroxy-2-butanone-4-phosphate synthase [Actinobacteria bacterium]|nr:3,4-dihydroxy-2-butanone-4-phosphate synthase [Actinomycetota bacterium]MCI0678259.1 3,4-dihydroxy-2-butanone-4-phosphate synthase [Actinomycetota bacterium]